MLSTFVAKVADFVRREESPTYFEYALLVIVIALVVVTAAVTVGTSVAQWFEDAANAG